jgi:hypothetical protein
MSRDKRRRCRPPENYFKHFFMDFCQLDRCLLKTIMLPLDVCIERLGIVLDRMSNTQDIGVDSFYATHFIGIVRNTSSLAVMVLERHFARFK